MIGNLSETQEIGLLKYLAELTSIGDLENLLVLIVRKTPALLNVRGCSIYLTPEFVQGYTGNLVDAELKQISSKEIKDEFIVLAQTNNEKKRDFLGKIFYSSGGDLTGWVFQTGRILICKNSRDPEELSKIQGGLKPSTRYQELDLEEESLTEPIPVLYIPLRTNSRIIGVLKLHRPKDRNAFTDIDEKFATIIAQVIAGIAEKIQIMSHQEKQILELSKLGAERNPDDVIERVTKRVSEMLDCPKTEYYVRTDDGERMRLEFINGERVDSSKAVEYRKSQGFIGWIHRTGASVYVDDLREYSEEKFLDDSILARISDTVEVNEKDRLFLPLNVDFIKTMDKKIPFMATPTIALDGSVQGILCVHFLTRSYAKRKKPFNLVELQQLKTFSGTISLALQFDLFRMREQFLLDISLLEDLPQLFDLVARKIPALIHGTDCFVYIKENNGDGPSLQLRASNQHILDISYELGKGKTGFAAFAGKTLVVDHVGAGKINERKIEVLKEKLRSTYPEDLVGDLADESKECVGVIRLRNSAAQTDPGIRWLFRELCNKQVIRQNNGLPSAYMSKYIAMGSRPSFSFVAVPISSDEGKLAGVITVARPADESPFSFEDIEFIESIAKALGHLINISELQEHRKDLFVNLAHEVNTYLTPLLADAENIREETILGSELGNMGAHLLGQVKRLQIMAETILAVFSQEESAVVQMEYHGIYRPLIDAIEMFRDEASFKGCDILEPVAVGTPRFPDIEMNLFELTLAFKNLIHNAIKYSYKPPKNLDRNRFIRVDGEWYDKEKRFYCINIQNYGVGISSEEIASRIIFKPFHRGIYSGDRNRTGSGIGLGFVAKIVEERHHGKILVVSIPQGGGAHLTTFRIVLPVRQAKEKKGSSK